MPTPTPGRLLAGLLVVCVLLACPVGGALAGSIIVPIPGLDGARIQVAGAARTAGGGAILAARVDANTSGAAARIVTVSLQADGALNLAYGTEGIATLPVNPALVLTALAINPSTGSAWIAAKTGSAQTSEIIAVTPSGTIDHEFGNGGILRLPPADNGGPVAIAWEPQQLLIAAGQEPCGGCALSVRNASTGRPVRTFTLRPRMLAPRACRRGVAVTGATFQSAGAELVSTRSPARRGCATEILALPATLRPRARRHHLPKPQFRDRAAQAGELAGTGEAICFAAMSRSAITFAALTTSSRLRFASAPGGSLLSLVPLGPAACAALISTPSGRATVAQMSAGNRRAAITTLPTGIRPLAMFRCNQHLLAIGTTSSAGQQTAMITPIPIVRGQFAKGAAAAIRAAASTGCR